MLNNPPASSANDADLTYRVTRSTAIGYRILEPGATQTCASVECLEKYWTALQETQNTEKLTDLEMRVSAGSTSIFPFW